jgi:two-component system, NarL family, sensor kinase
VAGAAPDVAPLSLPGGELASWLASWAFVPGIVIGVVFLPLLFPDGRLPSHRWWPLGLAGALAMAVPAVVLAVGTWPLRGPGLVPKDGEDPELVTAVFGITLLTALTLGAVSVVALTLRFRHAGAVQRQQIKWFAYCAAPSVPLGMFAQVQPYGPYLEFLGAALQLAGLGIGIFRFRLWDIDRLVNRTLVVGVLLALTALVYAAVVGWAGALLGERRGAAPFLAAFAVALAFHPARLRVQRLVDRLLHGDRGDP